MVQSVPWKRRREEEEWEVGGEGEGEEKGRVGQKRRKNKFVHHNLKVFQIMWKTFSLSTFQPAVAPDG